MINDIDIEFQSDQGKGQALVWVIDGDCLYDLPLNKNYAGMFLATTDILDVSNEYPDNEGITVRLINNGVTLEDFNTSEYFGSILLSSPQILDLADYPYGRYVQSPNAQFDGEKFIILNQDVTDFLP